MQHLIQYEHRVKELKKKSLTKEHCNWSEVCRNAGPAPPAHPSRFFRSGNKNFGSSAMHGDDKSVLFSEMDLFQVSLWSVFEKSIDPRLCNL